MKQPCHAVCALALAATGAIAQVTPPPPPFIAPARGYAEPGDPVFPMPHLEFDTTMPVEQVGPGPAGTVHTNRVTRRTRPWTPSASSTSCGRRGTTPPFPLDPTRGIAIDVAFDPLTSLFLNASRLSIVTSVNAQGEANFPNPRPFAPGVPFYLSSFGLDLTPFQWMWGGEAIVLR